MNTEHVVDLMDAIHNLPWLMQNWEKCDLEWLRESLRGYENKWKGRGGMVLCQIFDDVVSGREEAIRNCIYVPA